MMFMEFLIGFLLIIAIGGIATALDKPSTKSAHLIFMIPIVGLYSISVGRFLLEYFK